MSRDKEIWRTVSGRALDGAASDPAYRRRSDLPYREFRDGGRIEEAGFRMHMTPAPGMLAIRHAEENASNEPTNDAGIMAIPRGDGGYPSHLLAVFGDVSLQSISKAGASCGIPLPTIIEAYRVARLTVAGANPELNEALNGGWQGGSIAEQRLAVVI